MPPSSSKYTFTLKFEKEGFPHVWGTLDGPGMHTTMGLVPSEGNVLGLWGPGEYHLDQTKNAAGDWVDIKPDHDISISIDGVSATRMAAHFSSLREIERKGELQYSYPASDHCVAAINDWMAAGGIGRIDQYLGPKDYQKIGPVMGQVVRSDARSIVSESPKVADVMTRLEHLLSQISLPRNKARALLGVQDYIVSGLVKGKSPQTIAYEIVVDRLGADIGNLSAERDITSVVDPVQNTLGLAGYGPADPDVVADAYVEGRASGLTHEEAVEYATGKAKDVVYAADVRALKEAASWNAAPEKIRNKKATLRHPLRSRQIRFRRRHPADSDRQGGNSLFPRGSRTCVASGPPFRKKRTPVWRPTRRRRSNVTGFLWSVLMAWKSSVMPLLAPPPALSQRCRRPRRRRWVGMTGPRRSWKRKWEMRPEMRFRRRVAGR